MRRRNSGEFGYSPLSATLMRNAQAVEVLAADSGPVGRRSGSQPFPSRNTFCRDTIIPVIGRSLPSRCVISLLPGLTDPLPFGIPRHHVLQPVAISNFFAVLRFSRWRKCCTCAGDDVQIAITIPIHPHGTCVAPGGPPPAPAGRLDSPGETFARRPATPPRARSFPVVYRCSCSGRIPDIRPRCDEEIRLAVGVSRFTD